MRHQKEGRQNYKMIKFILTPSIKTGFFFFFKALSPQCCVCMCSLRDFRVQSATTKLFRYFEPSVSSLPSLGSAGLLHLVVQNKAPETFPTCLWHRSGGPAPFLGLKHDFKVKGREVGGTGGGRSAFPQRRRKTRLLPQS